MGFDPITAVIGAVISVYSYSEQRDAQKEARAAQQRAADEQTKARQEQQAQNSAQAAAERRAQLREERIRRARILQASANTGVIGSSGEMGAGANLSTQLASNVGFNKGALQSANNISAYNQSAADFMNSAQNSMNEANQWGQIGGLGMSIFQSAGGFNTLGKVITGTQAPAPVENRVAKPVR